LEKQGKFSPEASQFIRMTKPEYFEKIMNEIADTGTETKADLT
jgi:hypothetical protein